MFGVGLRTDAELVEGLPFFAVQMLLHVAALLVAKPEPMRRWLALVLVFASGAVSWILPGPSFFRFCSCMYVVLLTVRTVDLVTWRDDPPAARVWLGLAVFDTWRARKAEPGVDLALLKKFGVVASLAGLGIVGAYAGAEALREQGAGEVLAYGVRWVCGGIGFLALFETIDVGSRLVYARMGIVYPPINRQPWRSRTLDEFWGRRWNTVVGGWFRRHLFAPLARRGHPRWGMAASFFASVLMHLWTVAQPAGATFLLPMGAFFALQGLFTMLERPLRVRYWSAATGRAWTLGIIALTSPLFVEPMLTIFDFL